MSLRIGVLAMLISMVCAPAFGRSWSDMQGRKVEAEFVRIFNGNVVLKSKGRIVNVPWEQLSEADQDFLREKLEASGKGNLIPKTPIQSPSGLNNQAGANPQLNPAQPNAGQPAAMPQPNAGQAGAMPQPRAGHAGQPPPGAMPPGYMPPGNMPPGSMPAGTMPGYVPPGTMPSTQTGHAGPAMPPSGASPSTMGHSNVASPQMNSQANANQSRNGSPFPAARPASMPGMPSSPANNPAFAPGMQPGMQPTMQMVYSCSKCNKELPSTVHAGDHCPHCGAYMEYEEIVGGGRKYAKWGWRGGIGAIVAIIIGLVQWARNRNATA